MGRQTRRDTQLSQYELDAQDKIRERNAEQAGQIPEPALPSTGTTRIESLMAEVRRRREEAVLAESSVRRGDSRTEADYRTEIVLDRQVDLANNPFRPASYHGDPLPPAG